MHILLSGAIIRCQMIRTNWFFMNVRNFILYFQHVCHYHLIDNVVNDHMLNGKRETFENKKYEYRNEMVRFFEIYISWVSIFALTYYFFQWLRWISRKPRKCMRCIGKTRTSRKTSMHRIYSASNVPHTTSVEMIWKYWGVVFVMRWIWIEFRIKHACLWNAKKRYGLFWWLNVLSLCVMITLLSLKQKQKTFHPVWTLYRYSRCGHRTVIRSWMIWFQYHELFSGLNHHNHIKDLLTPYLDILLTGKRHEVQKMFFDLTYTDR